MAGFDIDGCWQGEYVYGPNELVPQLPPSVRFTLTARGGWFGKFQGTIQDDPERGVADTAAVRGQIQGRTLTFTKRYPTVYTFCDGRLVSLADFMQSQHGLPLDCAVPGIPIFYEGEYDPRQESLSGTWYYEPQRVNVWSSGQRYEMETPPTSGRWTAHRGAN